MFREMSPSFTDTHASTLPRVARVLVASVITAGGAALLLATLRTDKAPPELAVLVSEQLATSGVENPVTAVLLNFRSYDTLLEIAVLLIVAIAMQPHASSQPRIVAPSTNNESATNLVLTSLLRWLIPLSVLVGGYLLWTGAYAPGGAFQAGAVLAAAGVALALTERYQFGWQSAGAQWLISAGLAIFIATGIVSGMVTGTFLQYPVTYAATLILVVEIAATVSIAAILLQLFTRLARADVTSTHTSGASS